MVEAATREISIGYYAVLREQRGLSSESYSTVAATARELYDELRRRHNFSLDPGRLAVAVNDEFKSWDYALQNGDRVVFIPPVAGG
jgi:molybdopterin converting factor small subunit